MNPRFSRTFAATAAVVGLSGCAAAPVEHHWVSVKPVRTVPQTELTGVDGDYGAAVAAIERRDYALALDLLQTANAQKDDDVRILNAFGVVYDKLGRFDLSSRYYARAHAADASSAIVASNQAYSAVLQGQAPPTAAPRALASAATQTSAAVTPAVGLSPAPLAEAPRAPVLTVAAANLFRTATRPAIPAIAPPPAPPASAPIHLAAAPTLAQVRFSAAPVAVAPRAPVLAMAAPTLFRSAAQPAIRAVMPPAGPTASPPVYLPAAPNVVMTARLSPAPVAETPRAPTLALVSPAVVRGGVQPSLLHTLAQYLTPAPDASEAPVRPAPAARAVLAPARAASTPVTITAHTLIGASGAPIVLRSVPQTAPPQGEVLPGVVRLAAISPVVLGPIAQPLPSRAVVSPRVVRLAAASPMSLPMAPAARRRGLEIADASGRIGVAAPIRLQLAQLGWTTRKGPIAVAPRIGRTTITYAAYRAPVALSLARTLPRGVRLVQCGNACGGIRLTLGADSLSWPARIRAVLKAFG